MRKLKWKINWGSNPFSRLFDFSAYFNDPKLQMSVATVCLFLGSITFIAFFSYLFTWKADQDKVFQFVWSDFLYPDENIQNALGGFGAYISHYFIFTAIGLSSFLIPITFFTIALKYNQGIKFC